MSSANTDSAAISSANASITIQLTITAAAGAPRVPLTLSAPTTATELRRQVAATTHIPLTTLRLIYRGRLINDNDQNDVVAEFKLEEGSVLHCMGKPEQAPVENSVSIPTNPSVTVTSAPAAASATTATPVASSSESVPSLNLPSALQQMRAANTPAVYLTGVTTLDKILSNIISHPLEEKYRTLKIQNPAFQRRLGGIDGGDRAIRACGFIVVPGADGEGSAYSMTPTPEQWPALLQAKATLEQAVRQASSSTTTVASPAAPMMAASNAALPAGSALPWGALPTGGMPNAPEMQQMAAQLFSNPQQLQAMLQNPMVQTMLRNDPQFASNPEMAQAIDEMIRNPEVLSQMSQMMSDPMVQSMLLNNPEAMQQYRNQMATQPIDARVQQFQQMMQQMNRGSALVPPTDPTLLPQYQYLMQQRRRAATPGTSSGSNPSSSNAAPGANDAELTEEEMIAEAIRRSLQDNNNNGGGSGS